MKIAIIGASGFVGQQLTDYLLEMTNHQLVLFSHKATRLQYPMSHERRMMHIDGNVLQANEITTALEGCSIAVYLVHLMGAGKTGEDFSSLEKQAATNFASAVTTHGIKRVIYVGGMGDASATLTKHLESRAATGAIIRAKVPQLIELRTPMIIGKGGAGYEVLTMLVRKFPLLPVPRWAHGTTQPITVHDVVRYIIAAMDLKTSRHETIDIGGPERLSYIQVAQRYAAYQHKQLHTVPVPFAPKSVIKWVLRRFKSNIYAITVADMLDSAGYSTVITDSKARKLFPDITPQPIETAF